MKMSIDQNLRRDVIKLAFVSTALAGLAGLFIMNPSLSTPTMLSIVITMVFSPMVAGLERRGYPRALSITIIFAGVGGLLFSGATAALRSGDLEWDALQQKVPTYFQQTVASLRATELKYKREYPFLKNVHPVEGLVEWGEETGKWFVTHGPSLMGEILSWIFIVPLLSFVLMNEGPLIRRKFFQLVPNRFFETIFIATNQISTALSDYVRAKLLEAFLVGILTTSGFMIVGAPYSVVLGVIAGITNIVPYLGPVIGAIPGIAIVLLDPTLNHLLWPVGLVYIIANVIDMVVIFPIVVAKLVNLHPLILIAVVAIGQHFYGLVGMLISIPVAASAKVVIEELYKAVYDQTGRRTSFVRKNAQRANMSQLEHPLDSGISHLAVGGGDTPPSGGNRYTG